MAKSNMASKKKTTEIIGPEDAAAEHTTHQPGKSLSEFLAEKAKGILQGLIAIGIVILLITKLFYHLDNSFEWDWKIFKGSEYFITVLRLPTLELVGKALAYAAGVDLAYMLLTPGPDEAIEPLILGLASAILFSVSRIGDTDIELAQEIGLYVIILSGLFFVKALFIPNKNDEPSQGVIAPPKNMFTNWLNRMKTILRIT